MADPYALHMPHWPKPMGAEPAGTPGERARMLLACMGNPERRLPPVIHVGGTKGKGSTIAFLRAMLEAAGYKVHAYTSPHLARFNERIVIAGAEIDDNTLFSALEETRKAAGDMAVGFFDATTAAAMLAFASHPADIMLMEMGLGGSVDATNILDAPRLTILSTLSYDHMEYMGPTLESIAAFETGLFKPHVPCIVSYQHPGVWPVLRERAIPIQAPLYEYGAHWQVATRQMPEGNAMVFADSNGEALLPLPALAGAHQLVNAGNAIAALTALDEFDVDGEAIAYGLVNATWKGRLQRFTPGFVGDRAEIWFDGGHNHAAGEAIAHHAATHWQDKALYIVFGTTQGKDVASILAPFADIVQRVYVVEVKSEPKSYRTPVLARMISRLMGVEEADSIEDAIRQIMNTETHPFRVLIFGSLYLWLEASLL